MPDALVTSIISGGGCVALAFAVWLQQRDMTSELRQIRISLARVLQTINISDDHHEDTDPEGVRARNGAATPAFGIRRRAATRG